MKATLHLRPHSILPDTQVIEVHFNGALLCTISGADGPGVRIISKHITKGNSGEFIVQPAQGKNPGVFQFMLHPHADN